MFYLFFILVFVCYGNRTPIKLLAFLIQNEQQTITLYLNIVEHN